MRVEILLKEKRKERNLTLVQLSDRTGISTTHINDIENNIKEPSISMMVRIAKALDLKIEDLYPLPLYKTLKKYYICKVFFIVLIKIKVSSHHFGKRGEIF